MTSSTELNQQLATEPILWDLNHLYPSNEPARIDSDIQWCRQEASRLNSVYVGKVATLSARELLTLVSELEALDTRQGKLATYTFLNFTTQMDNAKAGALDMRVHELISSCATQTVFFELEWNQLENSQAEALLADPGIAPYRHYLQAMRRYRPHQLTEKEERLLLEKEIAGRKSWTQLFSKIMSSLKFGESGRTEEEVLADLYDQDRTVRQKAAAEMTQALKDNGHILTHIFNTLAADKMVTDKLRSYPNWLASMNLSNEITDQTVEVLVNCVTSRYDLVARYYRLKKELLGLQQLEHFDRYAPLPSLPSTKVDWPTCRTIVLEAFTQFSPQMGAIAQRFFDEKWIHAPIHQGKRGGAFAHPCVPQAHPYVLVNYAGSLRDVSTVAHELGHGVHQVLSASQGYYSSDTPLPLAETASVFAELLVFNSQVKMIDDQAQRRAFICQKLESIFATVFRQTAMNRFEHKMHEGRRQHGELDSDTLSTYWLDTQQQMFGDSVELGQDYGLWWSYIPHFLSTPGYVYSYAFGELLVLALYSRYQQEGTSFVEKYLELLTAGGSRSPYELMEPFAIDLNDPDFWMQGLNTIEEMLALAE